MSKKKLLFIDRDGTLIREPEDQQIDSIEKFSLMPGVIPALIQLTQAGFNLVMVSNQDGLGTQCYPHEKYAIIQALLLNILSSQGIQFENIYICPHFSSDPCDCRKPQLGLVRDYLVQQIIDIENSYVIGDRDSDIKFAENLGIQGILIGTAPTISWESVAELILLNPRKACIRRKTKETDIELSVNLDRSGNIAINTGIGFFDHMLEQLAKHAGLSLTIHVCGDLTVDEHHTVEDTALALGEALARALSDKQGIARYGFLLPMDESLTQVALDLSGRPYCVFEGKFSRDYVGGFATELVSHFFHSLAHALKSTLHINVKGENNHHMIESVFKAVGRTLRQAIFKVGHEIPSTKGVL